MKFTITSPTKAYVTDYTELEMESLRKSLSYTNTAAQYDVKRHYNNHWLKNKNRKAWEVRLEELKSQVHNCLVFEDEQGIYIRPGSLSYLDIPDSSIENTVEYPEPKKMAWNKMLPYQLYDYQEQSVEKLMKARHGAVSLCTGSGKTAIVLKLLREFGLPAVVVVPSASIFNELLEKMEYHFGKGCVGGLGYGKRKLDKKFTIAISDSLVNIKPNTPEWEHFNSKKVMIVDEVHSISTDTLDPVTNNLLGNIPYRLSLSATHTRGDGSLMLLQSITGPIVHSLTSAEAVRGGYICPHDFKIVKIESSNPNYNSNDILEMKRIHILRNRNIASFIAKFVNAKALSAGEQTLVLVEELNQIALLLPLLKVPYAYAHSETSKAKLEEFAARTGVILEKVDKAESIEKFNKNEVKVLIGTSAIRVGVNLFPCSNTFNWVAGASEITTLQGAVGRSVRLHNANPWKDRCLVKQKCTIWDFDVTDIYPLKAQLKSRIEYYKQSESIIDFIDLKK